MPKQPNNSEIPPGAVSAANPEAGAILQLTPESELILSEYAKQRGIPQAEAVRQLLAYSDRRAEREQAKPTPMERTLGAIDEAQRLGVASNDPNDVINSMGRGVVIKSLAKGLEGDGGSNKKLAIDDLKEMWYLSIMGKMAGVTDNGGGAVPGAIQELKAQNEKLQQEMKERDEKHEQRIKDMENKQQAEKEKSETDKRFERLEQSQKDQFEKVMQELKNGGGAQAGKPSEVDKLIQEMKEKDAKHQAELEKMKADIRDMVFEKKIETLESTIVAKDEAYKQDIKTLNEKIELVGRIPPTVAPPKDAVSELEEIGGKLQRIKTAMEPIFPHVNAPAGASSSLTATPTTPLKNPDGSTDYVAAAERLGTIVVKGLEAINKEKPPKANITGAAQPAQQAYTEKRPTPEEYANYLLSLPTRTPDQEQWLLNYRAYLEKEYSKLSVAAPQQPVQPQPATQPVQQAEGCSICGNPIYKDELCGKCWADIHYPKQPVQQETPVMTWEQAEAIRNQLLQKPEWTDEEARWMNSYEQVRKEALAQQPQGAEIPVKEYKPPVGQAVQAVQAVQPDTVPQDVQQAVEEQPVEVAQTDTAQQAIIEQPQEVQPRVQAGVQAEQPQAEKPEGDTVEQSRKQEEERTKMLKGIL